MKMAASQSTQVELLNGLKITIIRILDGSGDV